MRRSWWVAGLFLPLCLVLTLLLNGALSLGRGLGSPVVWGGLLVVPFVAGGRGVRRALVRGLSALAALCLVFAAVVYLRVWTGAGGLVLEREGLVGLARWALAGGAVTAAFARWFSRRAASRAGASPARSPLGGSPSPGPRPTNPRG